MKRKILILGLFTALLVFQLIQFSQSYRNPIPLVSGSGFNIEITGGLAFPSDSTLQIDVLSGVLNASNSSTSLMVYNDGGAFAFDALNDCTINVSSPDAEGGYEFSISGANQTTQTQRFVFQSIIKTGNEINIHWRWRIESWVGNYTMFALGMGGLGLMVFSPTWGAYMIRKKGLDPDTIERCAYALLIFCMGFGLFVMWLWA